MCFATGKTFKQVSGSNPSLIVCALRSFGAFTLNQLIKTTERRCYLKKLLNNGVLATAAVVAMLIAAVTLNYFSLKNAAVLTLCVSCFLYGCYTVAGALLELDYLYARQNEKERKGRKITLCLFGVLTALLGAISFITVCVLYL